ncbi:MAG: hypothetical protein ACRENM_04155, partial [Candidatus Dormibacteraceae bacterium]
CYGAITAAGVSLVDAEGASRLVPAADVIVAAGQESEAALRPLLERSGVPHRVVGGAREVAGLNAVRAFEEGLLAAQELSRVAAHQGHRP